MICTKCGLNKDIDDFRICPNNYNKNYRRRICKECERMYLKEYLKKWYKTDKGKARASRKNKENVKKLNDNYVKNKIKHSGVNGKIPQELIELQRLQILLKREIYGNDK